MSALSNRGPAVANGNVMHCFFDADLRMGHRGLSQVAKDKKIKTGEIGAGSYIVFVNAARTGAKIYATGNIIAYFKPTRGKVDAEALRRIPTAFESKHLLSFGEYRYELTMRLGAGHKLRLVKSGPRG